MNNQKYQHRAKKMNIPVEGKSILENPNITVFRRKLIYSSIMLYQFRRRKSLPFPMAS